MHHCLWPGCDKVVPTSQWGCRPHWYRLPNTTRSWIGRAYRQGIQRGDHPSKSWRDAHAAALDFARAQETAAADPPT
jgi:hypothetical protein